MILPFVSLSWILLLLLVGLLVWFGISVRRLGLKLRSIYWVGIYLALSLILSRLAAEIIGEIVDAGTYPFDWSPGILVANWRLTESVLGGTARLIWVTMILSELAPLLARSSPVEELQSWDPLRAVRENMTLLGWVLLAMAILPFLGSVAMLILSGGM